MRGDYERTNQKRIFEVPICYRRDRRLVLAVAGLCRIEPD